MVCHTDLYKPGFADPDPDPSSEEKSDLDTIFGKAIEYGQNKLKPLKNELKYFSWYYLPGFNFV